MRHFTQGSGPSRKFVVVEVRGAALQVVKGKADGTTRRTERELASEAEARSASNRMAAELVARGFLEQVSDSSVVVPSRPSAVARPPKVMARVSGEDDGFDLNAPAAASDGDAVVGAAHLPRMSGLPSVNPAAEAWPKPKTKKVGARKKRKRAADGARLDQRVIALFVAVGMACVALVGYLGYDVFFKPPTIIGFWEGSRTEHEVGKFLTHTEYRLILDAQRNAAMTLQGKFTSTGTYDLQGNQLKLTFKDEDGEVSETRYQVALGRSTLDLFDPTSGNKVVELLRFRAKPAAVALAKPPEAPKDQGDARAANPAAEAPGTAADFLSKDGAFRLRRPVSWEVESGSRPDNTYSWARFTRDSAKVQVFADIAGSLMAGSNQSRHPEGSELAPVHAAHELYAKQAAEDHGDYQESAPALFKGSTLGEGRVATFTASGGSLLGAKLRGIRVTFLTNDRRITVLCEAPADEFDNAKPTFLALARSLAR